MNDACRIQGVSAFDMSLAGCHGIYHDIMLFEQWPQKYLVHRFIDNNSGKVKAKRCFKTDTLSVPVFSKRSTFRTCMTPKQLKPQVDEKKSWF